MCVNLLLLFIAQLNYDVLPMELGHLGMHSLLSFLSEMKIEK